MEKNPSEACGSLFRPKEGYLFIITYGRSGSTLTQRVLNSIPGYVIRGENKNILYGIAKSVHGLRENKKFFKNLRGTEDTRHPFFGIEKVDYRRFGYRMFDSFVSEILNPPESIRVLGFKEIRYHHDLGFLEPMLSTIEEFFPRTRFMFQTRDWESVSNSSWWRRMEGEEVRKIVSDSDDAFRKYASGKENCFIMDYSKFSQGLKGMEELFEFLGERMDEEVLDSILNERLLHCKEDHGQIRDRKQDA